MMAWNSINYQFAEILKAEELDKTEESPNYQNGNMFTADAKEKDSQGEKKSPAY